MRTLFAASTLALFSAVLLSACSSANESPDGAFESEPDTESTSEGLSRQGTVAPTPKPRPPTPPKHPRHDIIVGSGGVLAPPTCAGKERVDLRRKTRNCEELPGAYVQGGVTFVPGNGGRFRVGRLLAGTAAPAALQAKACIYTWEPDSCAASDRAKLLVEPTEKLVDRPASCITNPASCGPTTTSPAPPRPPGVIPNGTGRCDVCGFASNRSMWVVLPQYWHGFKFKLASEATTQFVYIDPPADPTQALDETTVVEVTLPYDVEPQDVSLEVAYD